MTFQRCFTYYELLNIKITIKQRVYLKWSGPESLLFDLTLELGNGQGLCVRKRIRKHSETRRSSLEEPVTVSQFRDTGRQLSQCMPIHFR